MLFACLLLLTIGACTKSPKPTETAPMAFRIVGLQSTREETVYNALESMRINYTTTATLEIVGPEKPPVNAFIEYADESGFSESATGKEVSTVFVHNGRGDIRIMASRKVEKGQPYPPVPKYRFRVLGIDPFQPIELVVDGSPANEPKPESKPVVRAVVSPIDVVEHDGSYFGRGSVTLTADDPALRSKRLLLVLRRTVISHPDPDDKSKTEWSGAVLVDGEATVPVNEFLGLSRTFGDDAPPPKPAAPEFAYEAFGYQELRPAVVATSASGAM